MNETVLRPWGWYKVLSFSDTYKVKLLFIGKGQRISLQKHLNRCESWTIINGSPFIIIDNMSTTAMPLDTFFVPSEAVHRIESADYTDTLILELQSGLCQEDDIIRLKDDYNR